MNVIMKTLAICLLVQLATTIVQADVEIESLTIANYFMQTSDPKDPSERQVVARNGSSPTKWSYEPTMRKYYTIKAVDVDEYLFAGESLVDNRRQVFTWSNEIIPWDPTNSAGLWEFQFHGDAVYIRNEKYNEYLCTDTAAPKIDNYPIVYTGHPGQKEICGQWKFVSAK